MTAFTALMTAEARLFWRQGLVAAAAVLTLVWVGLLHLTPSDDRLFWLGLVSGMDVTAMGLLFGFGLGLIDRNQGTLIAWRLTPAPTWLFGVCRVLVMTGLLTACLVTLSILTVGPVVLLTHGPGLVLLALEASLIGLVFGRGVRDLNGFIIAQMLTLPIWVLPFLGYAGWLEGALPWLWPMSGGLYWLHPAPTPPLALATISLVQVVWIVTTAWLAEWLAPRHLGHRAGARP